MTALTEHSGTEMDAVKVVEQKAENKNKKENILFVCTGNTCRSPMAQALFSYKYASVGDASSAGISATDGMPLSSGASAALKARKVPPDCYAFHTARRISEGLIKSADRVICMTGIHANRLILSYPLYAGKIFAMPFDISDPYGGDDDVYISCLDEIERGLDKMFGGHNND